MTVSGGVVACVARDEGIGMGGHGHLQKMRNVGVGQNDAQGKGGYRHTISLDLVEEDLDLLRGEGEFGTPQ